jgi:hypothetical protein
MLAPAALAQFQMPDPKQMAGIPRPVSDLADGSVSVRLIRGQLSNNIANHVVELRVGSKVLQAKTDAAGRAQFDKLTAGERVKAVVDIDGEHLESEEFPAPRQGGIRLILVATDTSQPAVTEGTAPAVGQIVLSNNSRLVLEPKEEALELYYILELSNSARTKVTTNAPFAFSMPSGATACSLLEGSSPLASVKGPRVTVQGPFPPGNIPVQIGCELAVKDGSLDIAQHFPAKIERLSVIVKKVGSTKLRSAQLTNQREMTADGETYITAVGPAVAGGQPILLSLEGLPRHSPAPRWIALSLALAIVVVGLWASVHGPQDVGSRVSDHSRLVSERNRLFNDLIRLERDHQAGGLNERVYTVRRGELLTALERVYGALDSDEVVGPVPSNRSSVPTALSAFGAS